MPKPDVGHRGHIGGGRTGDGGPDSSHGGCPQVAEDEYPVQKEIRDVGDNQRAHIEFGQVDAVPVSSKSKIDAHA